jgi:hypothetical protein
MDAIPRSVVAVLALTAATAAGASAPRSALERHAAVGVPNVASIHPNPAPPAGFDRAPVRYEFTDTRLALAPRIGMVRSVAESSRPSRLNVAPSMPGVTS